MISAPTESERTVTGMAEYIERTEELILSMRAGSRAISNTKKYHGTIYMLDVFSDDPKEIPYLKASEILYAASEEKSADVAPVRHGKWIRVGYACGETEWQCSSCKEIKELVNFSKNKKSWDGLKPYCKECASNKGKQYRLENRECE